MKLGKDIYIDRKLQNIPSIDPLPWLQNWNVGWLASIATETGPTVATADFNASSSPGVISTNPTNLRERITIK